MAIAAWMVEKCLGDDLIDRQHRALVEAVNGLHGLLRQPDGAERAVAPFAELMRITGEHIDAEEALMAARSVPDRQAHLAEHRMLLDRGGAILEDHRRGRRPGPLVIGRFLGEWMRHLLHGEDRTLADWLSADPAR